MARQYETYMKTFRKVVTGLLVVNLFLTICYLFIGLSDLNNERLALETKKDTNFDPSQYDMATMILCGSCFIAIIVLSLGLFAVFFKSFCTLLFFSTTGTGIFILLIITLLLEHIISFLVSMLMVILIVATSTLSLYYAFEINRYKDYRPKLPNDQDYVHF